MFPQIAQYVRNILGTSKLPAAPVVRPSSIPAPRVSTTLWQLSHAGAALIKHFEGCTFNVVDDGAGYPTIGWGHKLVPGDGINKDTILTQDECDALFDKEIAPFEFDVNNLVKVPITQGEFDALVSFAYNVGSGALAHSTLLRDINAGNYTAAANQFPIWDHAGGRVMLGLTRRRIAEEKEFDGESQ
jgi:lysozyme